MYFPPCLASRARSTPNLLGKLRHRPANSNKKVHRRPSQKKHTHTHIRHTSSFSSVCPVSVNSDKHTSPSPISHHGHLSRLRNHPGFIPLQGNVSSGCTAGFPSPSGSGFHPFGSASVDPRPHLPRRPRSQGANHHRYCLCYHREALEQIQHLYRQEAMGYEQDPVIPCLRHCPQYLPGRLLCMDLLQHGGRHATQCREPNGASGTQGLRGQHD